MKKRHIIFDLDGTLSDTAKATAIAIEEVCGKRNLPKVDYKRILSAMGLSDMEFCAHVFPDIPLEDLPDIQVEVDSLEEQMIIQFGVDILFPGVDAMLSDLGNKGCCLYIASTGSKRHVDVTLKAGGIKDYFTGVSCGEPGKVMMVKNMIAGRDLEEWMMVGDMFKDSEAARGNNILALGAGFGYLSGEDHTLFDSILWEPGDIFGFL